MIQPQQAIYQQPKAMQLPPPPPPAQPQYNAVKIDIINPTATPGTHPSPQQPIYNYPYAPTYSYPQPSPQVMTPVIPQPVVPKPVITQPAVAAPQKQEPAEPAQKPVEQKAVEQKPSEPEKLSTADAKSFITKLQTTAQDPKQQEEVIKEIATIAQADKAKAVQMLDEDLIRQLLSVVAQDTSKLAAPTPEQIELRQKAKNGEKLTPEQQTKADELSMTEIAERNKQYALYTISLLDKVLIDELKAKNVPITANKIPAIAGMVDALKGNPNPFVREAAAAAIEYIATPDFKADLTPIMELAKQDTSKDVQQRAQMVLNKLNAASAAAPVAAAQVADKAVAAEKPEETKAA